MYIWIFVTLWPHQSTRHSSRTTIIEHFLSCIMYIFCIEHFLLCIMYISTTLWPHRSTRHSSRATTSTTSTPPTHSTFTGDVICNTKCVWNMGNEMYMEYGICNAYGIWNMKCMWNMEYAMHMEYRIWNVCGIWNMQWWKMKRVWNMEYEMYV